MEATTRIVLVTGGAAMATPDPETHFLVDALDRIGIEAFQSAAYTQTRPHPHQSRRVANG